MAEVIPDGIHFGLDEDAYHADPALGSSDIKAIAMDPVDWQFMRITGEREETDAMILGSALHKRLLEGRAAFEAAYVCELEKPEGVLITNDDLSGWLKGHGLSGAGTKPALIERIQGSGIAQPKIWHVMQEEFKARNGARIELSRAQWEKIETAAKWMQADATLSASMVDGAFQHGAPEVSIFYTDDGVRLKARFDYWIAHAVIDLKSFATMFKEEPAKAVIRAIMRQRYDIQVADYVNAWHAGRDLFKAGKVFGDVPDGFLKKVYSRAHPLWVWVFLKSVGAPQPFVRSLSHEEMVFSVAQSTVRRAIEIYRAKVAEFGTDAMWPPANPPEALSSSDFPQWFGN
jgi:hypothetical protein